MAEPAGANAKAGGTSLNASMSQPISSNQKFNLSSTPKGSECNKQYLYNIKRPCDREDLVWLCVSVSQMIRIQEDMKQYALRRSIAALLQVVNSDSF